MKASIRLMLFGASLGIAPGCSNESSKGPSDHSYSHVGGKAGMESDLQTVDEYLSKWDRFATGKNDLVPFLRQNKKNFESALARLLNATDKRAPARMVFYSVVQVGGSIPVESDLGKAAAIMLGTSFPVTTTKDGERTYFAGDLFFWWGDNCKKYDTFPLFDEWSMREFAQTVVIPIYKSARNRR